MKHLAALPVVSMLVFTALFGAATAVSAAIAPMLPVPPVASIGAGASATDSMSSEIQCGGPEVSSPRAAVLSAMRSQAIGAGAKDVQEISKTFQVSGWAAGATDRLTSDSKVSVESEAALANRGFIVSAKMLHDDAMHHPDYRAVAFSGSIARYMAISVEPVHDSDGETNPSEAGSLGVPGANHHGHDDGLTVVSNALQDVLRRVSTAKSGLGNVYTLPAVRFYILGHAFRDPVAVQASSRLICSSHLTPGQLKAVAMAADFVRGRKLLMDAPRGSSRDANPKTVAPK